MGNVSYGLLKHFFFGFQYFDYDMLTHFMHTHSGFTESLNSIHEIFQQIENFSVILFSNFFMSHFLSPLPVGPQLYMSVGNSDTVHFGFQTSFFVLQVEKSIDLFPSLLTPSLVSSVCR